MVARELSEAIDRRGRAGDPTAWESITYCVGYCAARDGGRDRGVGPETMRAALELHQMIATTVLAVLFGTRHSNRHH